MHTCDAILRRLLCVFLAAGFRLFVSFLDRGIIRAFDSHDNTY